MGKGCVASGRERVRLDSPAHDGRADESGGDERFDEPVVVPTDHALYAERERLHDLRLDARHEPKVQKDETAVVAEHHIALVRVGVHETSEHEARGHRLARHRRHLEPLLRGEMREVPKNKMPVIYIYMGRLCMG